MSKKKTHEEFLKDLWNENEHYRNGEFEVIGIYECALCKILLRDKYGEGLIIPATLLSRGAKPNIKSAIDKTQYWKNMCLDRFGEEGNDDLSEVEYSGAHNKVKIIDPEFGEYWITPDSYYQNRRSNASGNVKIGNKLKANQKEVFNKIRKLHPDLEILPDQEYEGMNTHILVKGKYGVCRMTPSKLFNNNHMSIRSAVDKTPYFINQAKEKHGDKYDYSLVDWKKSNQKVKIICPKYGVFQQSPNDHLQGKGCPIEGYKRIKEHRRKNPTGWGHEVWIKSGEKSKYFDSYKVYFIECWDEETGEHFYKIGRTYKKVFGGKSIESRFSKKPTKGFPYKAKLLHMIEYEDGRKICELEDYYKKLNKEYKYLPDKKFNGMHECFSKIEYEKIIKN